MEVPAESTTETEVNAAHIIKIRKTHIPPLENCIIFNLNCNPEAASKEFLAEAQKSNACHLVHYFGLD